MRGVGRGLRTIQPDRRLGQACGGSWGRELIGDSRAGIEVSWDWGPLYGAGWVRELAGRGGPDDR